MIYMGTSDNVAITMEKQLFSFPRPSKHSNHLDIPNISTNGKLRCRKLEHISNLQTDFNVDRAQEQYLDILDIVHRYEELIDAQSTICKKDTSLSKKQINYIRIDQTIVKFSQALGHTTSNSQLLNMNTRVLWKTTANQEPISGTQGVQTCFM